MVAAQVAPPARRPLFSCSPGAPGSWSRGRDHQLGRIIDGGFRCRGHRRPDEFPGPRRIGRPELGIGSTPAGKQPAVLADSAPVPVRIRAAGTESQLLPWSCTGASSWTSSAGPARRRAGTPTHPPLGDKLPRCCWVTSTPSAGSWRLRPPGSCSRDGIEGVGQGGTRTVFAVDCGERRRAPVQRRRVGRWTLLWVFFSCPRCMTRLMITGQG